MYPGISPNAMPCPKLPSNQINPHYFESLTSFSSSSPICIYSQISKNPNINSKCTNRFRKRNPFLHAPNIRIRHLIRQSFMSPNHDIVKLRLLLHNLHIRMFLHFVFFIGDCWFWLGQYSVGGGEDETTIAFWDF